MYSCLSMIAPKKTAMLGITCCIVGVKDQGKRTARLGHDALLGAKLRGDGLQVAEVFVVRELARAEPPESRV